MFGDKAHIIQPHLISMTSLSIEHSHQLIKLSILHRLDYLFYITFY